MHHERRHGERQPVGFYVDQFLDEELLRYFATDLSMHGLYLESPVERRRLTPRTLQLEIPLPQVSDVIWASAEVVYERVDALFHGRGVRFTAMTERHTRCLRDWLRENARTERFITHPARAARTNRPTPRNRFAVLGVSEANLVKGWGPDGFAGGAGKRRRFPDN